VSVIREQVGNEVKKTEGDRENGRGMVIEKGKRRDSMKEKRGAKDAAVLLYFSTHIHRTS